VQQTKPFVVIINRDKQKSSLVQGNTEYLWWNSHFKQIYVAKLDYISAVITA